MKIAAHAGQETHKRCTVKGPRSGPFTVTPVSGSWRSRSRRPRRLGTLREFRPHFLRARAAEVLAVLAGLLAHFAGALGDFCAELATALHGLLAATRRVATLAGLGRAGGVARAACFSRGRQGYSARDGAGVDRFRILYDPHGDRQGRPRAGLFA